MDAITIKDVLELLRSGGDVALIFGIYFGSKMLAAAKGVVDTFDQIAIDVAHVRKAVDKHLVRGYDDE